MNTPAPLPPRITWVAVEEARSDASLVSECGRILEPFYASYRVPLEYALIREGDRLYLERDKDGHLLAFFVADTPKVISPHLPPIAYMGLTAQSIERHVGNGAARRLWERFIFDVRAIDGFDDETIVWYRTATPFGLYPCHHLLIDGQPMADGTYTDEMARVILLLRGLLNLDGQPSDHPFVLRGVAAARYSSRERQRIHECRQSNNPSLLDVLGVNEQNGDRLLMIGRIKAKE